MRDYTSARSEFVKQKIRESSYSRDKDYIDELLAMEQYILGADLGKWAGMRARHWETKHSGEFKNLWLELNPQEYERRLNSERLYQQKAREDTEKRKEQSRLRDILEQETWVKAGGKLD